MSGDGVTHVNESVCVGLALKYRIGICIAGKLLTPVPQKVKRGVNPNPVGSSLVHEKSTLNAREVLCMF